MSNLNDLYKEFFAKTIDCGLALPAELEEIAQQIRGLQTSTETSTCSAKPVPEIFAGIH